MRNKYCPYGDVENFIAAFLEIAANFISKQKGRNVVLISGNNNNTQIPNEQGDGSNKQA